MAPAQGRGRRRGRIELQMTPMIDIVFNLVIFFMLMPSFQHEFLPTNLPSGLGPDPDAVVRGHRLQLRHVEPWLQHRHDAEIVFCGEVLPDYAALRSRLRETRASLPKAGRLASAPLVIEPDQAVEHRHVVAAFDAAVDAGFENIRFSVPK